MTNEELMLLLNGMVKKAQDEKSASSSPQGQSSHPTDNVDDGTVNADEGEHGREKSQDVKDAIPAETVDESGELVGDASPKGDVVTKYDAEQEPDKTTKTKKDDPGTSSAFKVAGDKMKSLLAEVAVIKAAAEGEEVVEEAPAEPVVEEAVVEETQPAEPVVEEAPAEKEAGDKAEALGEAVGDAVIDSLSSDISQIQNIQKKAAVDARAVCEFLYGYEKAAEELPPELEAELLASQGAGGGEEGAPAVSPEEMLGAAPEEGLPPEAGLGAEGAGIDEEQALEELAIALDEAGITPEELVAAAEGAMQGEEGGMGGALAGGLGGEAPPEEAPLLPPEVAPEAKMAQSQLVEIMKATKVLLKHKNK